MKKMILVGVVAALMGCDTNTNQTAAPVEKDGTDNDDTPFIRKDSLPVNTTALDSVAVNRNGIQNR
jgi:hypothetical protein